VTFDPKPSFEGVATIPYVVSDDDGNVSAPANISVTVAGAAPLATADAAITATDPGIDSTLTTPEGVWSVDAAGVVSFDPIPGFEGTATVPYVVSDAGGNVSLPANISVTVTGAAPVATADSATTAADTIATVALADNVNDANNDADITTVDLDPSTPGIDNTVTTAAGVWSVDPTGVVTFDPAPGFEGTATVPYVVSDSGGNVSAFANISTTM